MATKVPENASGFKPFEDQGIQLPFDAPLFWWTNGDNRGKEVGSGVEHFGGWATDGALLDAMVHDTQIPARLIAETQYPRTGASFQVYATRYLVVTPIAKRFRWVTDRDKPNDKGRGHSQILCLCAFGKPLEYWMPVVLSAKGLAAMAIDAAFKSWESETGVARKTWAHGAGAWFFWSRIGTFAKERIEKLVGQKGAQSPIVEAQIYLPSAEFTEAYLDALYIGEENVNRMVELKTLSKEWVAAWAATPVSGENQVYQRSKPDEEIPF